MIILVNDSVKINHPTYTGTWVVLSVNSIKRSVKVRADSDVNAIRVIEVPIKLITK